VKQAASPGAKPKGKRSEVPARLLPRRFRTADGLEVWVGRQRRGNDYMTPGWHAGTTCSCTWRAIRGATSSCAPRAARILRPNHFWQPCELAVHFSRMKSSGHAEIHVACIKDVRKPKGAKPGLVYVRRGRTIRLRRDPERWKYPWPRGRLIPVSCTALSRVEQLAFHAGGLETPPAPGSPGFECVSAAAVGLCGIPG